MKKNLGRLLPIILLALITVLLLLFGLSQCSKTEITLVVQENQDNLMDVPVYDETHSHTFAFYGPEEADGTVIYELISAKDQDFNEVDYFKLVSDYETKIIAKAGTPSGLYTLTIRVYCLTENGKQIYKDITYIYKVDKAKSEYTLEPSIIEDLIYNGNMQQLMHEGSALYGTIMYKLDDGEWSEEVPSALEAGIYTVSYKLVGDGNHEDIKEKSFMVTIRQATVAYRPGISFNTGASLTSLLDYIRSNTHNDDRIVVESASSAYVEVTYNGEIQYNGYHCPNGVDMVGVDCGINAGTYIAIYTPLPNYCWPDGTRVPITVTLVIKKKALPMPEVNDVLQYNGEWQYANISNYDEETMCILGNRGKEVGEYTAVIVLKDKENYRWADGRITDVVLKWHIFAKKVTVPEVSTIYVYKTTDVLHLPVLQCVKQKDFNYFDPDLMEIVCGDTGLLAGDYEVRVRLKNKENYAWNDEEGGSEDRYIPWKILRKTIGDKPENVEVTFDGCVHGNGYGVKEGVLIDGPISGYKAGDYVAVYTPLDNYCWSDGTYEKVEVTLKINKAKAIIIDQPVAFENLVYNGNFMPLLKEAGNSDAGVMLYKTVYEGEESHYTYLPPMASEAGTYRVYYYANGDENHYPSDEEYIDVTIAKAEPVITAKPGRVETMYDGSSHELVTQGKSGHGHFEYRLENTDFSTQIPQAQNAGTYYIYVKFVGDPNHKDKETYTVISRILKDNDAQYVQRPEEKNMTYTGQPLSLAEEGVIEEEVGQILYSLDKENWYAEVPKGTEVGSYEVFYMIKGSSNYEDSPIESLTSEIVNADLQVSLTVKQEYVYQDEVMQGAPVIVTTVDGSDAEITYVYNDQYFDKENYPQFNEVKLDNRGRAAERVVFYTAEAANHNSVSGVYTILIKKADPIINIEGLQLTYTGQSQKLVTASVKGGTIEYSESGYLYHEVVPTRYDVGEYKVYYRVIGDDNHNDIYDSRFVTASISNADMIITAPDQPHVYDGNKYGDPISAVTVDETPAKIRYGTKEGEYNLNNAPRISEVNETMIVYYKVTAKNHNDVTGSYHLTITKAEPGFIAPQAIEKLVYDGSNQALIVEGSSEDGTMMYKTGDEETYSTSVPTGMDPGDYEVWYYCAGDDNHSNSDPQHFTVTIYATQEEADQPQQPNQMLGGALFAQSSPQFDLDNVADDSEDQKLDIFDTDNNVADGQPVDNDDTQVTDTVTGNNVPEEEISEDEIEKLIIAEKPERAKVDLNVVRINSQVDKDGKTVSYFKSDGNKITMDKDTPEGTYIVEATVRIVWTVDKEGNTRMVILDAETNKEIQIPDTSSQNDDVPSVQGNDENESNSTIITPLDPIEEQPHLPDFVVPETNNQMTEEGDDDEDEVTNVQSDGDVYEDHQDNNIVISDPPIEEGSSEPPVEEGNSDPLIEEGYSEPPVEEENSNPPIEEGNSNPESINENSNNE